MFKWLQTAISIRHADTVDVKFILQDESGARTEKTMALPHAFLVDLSRATGRKMDDAWCARIAELHLLRQVETGEDMEKDLVTLSAAELQEHAAEIARLEQAKSPAN
jgi:hypothetical protein